MSKLISVNGVDASYGESQALFDVSLQAESGSLIALVGRNGAGKTTMLRCLSGLLAPDKGTIEIDGEDVTGESPHDIAKHGVALCPEDRKLFPKMSVLDNLRVGTHLAKSKSEGNLERVYEYFPILEKRAGQEADTLSGGEQQMLTIGRSLMSGPDILLLDEPSEGLAPKLVTQMFETIAELNQKENLTIVLIEQNARKTLEIAEYGYLIKNGAIALSGSGDELRNADAIREVYLGG